MYYASKTRLSPLTKIRRERSLPKPGEALVDPGDRVEATQVVARASLSSGFRIVAVARLLGVSPSETENHLQTELGATVHRGDVIAKKGSILSRSVESPIDGVVTAMGGGRVLIEEHPTPFELHAHIPGTVLSVVANQKITIQTAGALIQATWGSGQESVGVLRCTSGRPGSVLQTDTVDTSCRGTILVTGKILDREPLDQAQNVEVRGIVTGGLSAELLPAVEELPFPVIVTEGFGDLPMTEEAFALLKENEGREASVSGETQTQRSLDRPEVVIPMPKLNPPTGETERYGRLVQGARVRVIRAPFLGAAGTIIRIPQYKHPIETGARTYCAEVDIGRDEPAFVPLVNLEILS